MKVRVCMKNDHRRDPEVIAVHLDLEKAREWMRAEYLAYRGKAPYLDLVITEHDTEST